MLCNELQLVSSYVFRQAPNGLRYPRVGGRRERRFAGTRLRPRKLLENAARPTRRVHAVLGSFWGVTIALPI